MSAVQFSNLAKIFQDSFLSFSVSVGLHTKFPYFLFFAFSELLFAFYRFFFSNRKKNLGLCSEDCAVVVLTCLKTVYIVFAIG